MGANMVTEGQVTVQASDCPRVRESREDFVKLVYVREPFVDVDFRTLKAVWSEQGFMSTHHDGPAGCALPSQGATHKRLRCRPAVVVPSSPESDGSDTETEKILRRRKFRAVGPLDSLPDAVIVHVASWLSPVPDLLHLALAGPSLSVEKPELWRTLMASMGLRMPIAGVRPGVRTSRTTRSMSCPRRAFFRAYCKQIELERILCDETFSRAYALFCQHVDSAARIKQMLANLHTRIVLRKPDDVINHRHTLLEGNTLLNLAARCGCGRVMTFLIRDCHAQLTIPDVGGFTPLMNAAWRGDMQLVKMVLRQKTCTLDFVRAKGISRSDGPFDSLEWAVRRGHKLTADLLRRRIKHMERREPPCSPSEPQIRRVSPRCHTPRSTASYFPASPTPHSPTKVGPVSTTITAAVSPTQKMHHTPLSSPPRFPRAAFASTSMPTSRATPHTPPPSSSSSAPPPSPPLLPPSSGTTVFTPRKPRHTATHTHTHTPLSPPPPAPVKADVGVASAMLNLRPFPPTSPVGFMNGPLASTSSCWWGVTAEEPTYPARPPSSTPHTHTPLFTTTRYSHQGARLSPVHGAPTPAAEQISVPPEWVYQQSEPGPLVSACTYVLPYDDSSVVTVDAQGCVADADDDALSIATTTTTATSTTISTSMDRACGLLGDGDQGVCGVYHV